MRISDWSSDVCSSDLLQDYLLKPFGADQLREVFTQAQAVFNAPKILDPSAERPHLTTAVIGTRGGVGASTLATSLAWLMSAKGGRLTALLDLDVHFGTGALRSEEHTSELQSLMRISFAAFCLTQKRFHYKQ